jgi:hypothetical protein
MTDFDSALQFAAAAPFIVMILGIIKSYFALQPKILPLLAIGLSAIWGAILWQANYFDGDLPTYILTTFLVGTSASGIQSAYRTYAPTQ